MTRARSEHDFEVKPSTITGAGLGLFAKVAIGLEETIGYYTGEIVTLDDLDGGACAGSDYLLFVTRNHIIVGEGPKANYTRYINHSEAEANAYLITSNRWKTARFEATEEINPGDEIFFDYGECYWERYTARQRESSRDDSG